MALLRFRGLLLPIDRACIACRLRTSGEVQCTTPPQRYRSVGIVYIYSRYYLECLVKTRLVFRPGNVSLRATYSKSERRGAPFEKVSTNAPPSLPAKEVKMHARCRLPFQSVSFTTSTGGMKRTRQGDRVAARNNLKMHLWRIHIILCQPRRRGCAPGVAYRFRASVSQPLRRHETYSKGGQGGSSKTI